MERFDLDCICNHKRNEHTASMSYSDSKDACASFDNDFAICHCSKFKLDNLKYLEILSKEKEVADL